MFVLDLLQKKKILDLAIMSMLCSRLFRITVTDALIGWTCRSNILGDKVGCNNFTENPTLEIQVGR